MRELLIAIVVFTGLSWAGVLIFGGPGKNEAETNQRFIQIAKSDSESFMSNVESAVYLCAKDWDLPNTLSLEERNFLIRMVAKTMYLVVNHYNANRKFEIRRWIEESMKNESNVNLLLVSDTIESIFKSSNPTRCIVSNAVSQHDLAGV